MAVKAKGKGVGNNGNLIPQPFKKGKGVDPRINRKGQRKPWTVKLLRDKLLSGSGDAVGEVLRIAGSKHNKNQMTALKLVIETLVAKAETAPISFEWVTSRASLEDITLELKAVQEAVAKGSITTKDAERLVKLLMAHRETLAQTAQVSARESYELDAAVCDRIVARYPQAYTYSVRMVEMYQRLLTDAELDRRHPVVEVPKALVAAGKRAKAKANR